MMYKESEIGIEIHMTKTPGIGGKLKKEPEDFVVTEIPKLPERKKDGEYSAAMIMSRNWETNRLVRRLAKNLRISRRRIFFAGTKDKRAITTQLFVFSAPLEDIRALRILDVKVLNLYQTNKRIKFGDLLGNEFEIAIRDIVVPKNDVEQRVNSVKDEILNAGGFPNFFGVQRFGAVRPITHLVGKYIIQGEFKKAVDAYVANPIQSENREEFEARRALQETGDYSEALRTYPKTLSFEKAILNYLVKNKDDYVGGLYQLPKNLLIMFIHAYQSYLFNKILNARLARGIPINEPRVGDLIQPLDKSGLPDHERWIKVGDKNIEKVRLRCKEGKAFVSGILFGSECVFAEGEMGEIERGVVEEEGLKPENFIVPMMPQLSSKGIRRELMAPLTKLNCEIHDERVLLKFKLTKGCYATSMLREFMKSEDLLDY